MDDRIMRQILVLLLLALVACNTATDLRRWYVPTDSIPRTQKPPADVTVLEAEPVGREFMVVGIFAPPSNAFESYAEAVNGARRAAALFGADAVIIGPANDVQLQRRTVFDPATGVALRARAIVWK